MPTRRATLLNHNHPGTWALGVCAFAIAVGLCLSAGYGFVQLLLNF
jgi:hypothetical protein